MPLLFSYGTLREPTVQVATFGRFVGGTPSHLSGYRITAVAIDDPAAVSAIGRTHHANASYTGDPGDRVEGIALEVTDAELAVADAYEERDRYTRIAVTLDSGRSAWVYVHTPLLR